MEILAQSSTAFVLTHNFQGTHILGASRGHLSDSVASCITPTGSRGQFDPMCIMAHSVSCIRATNFIFDVHVPSDSPDSALQIFEKGT